MEMKAHQVTVGTQFRALNMCGPNHLYVRIENDEQNPTGVLALDLDWGGTVRFQSGVDVVTESR